MGASVNTEVTNTQQELINKTVNKFTKEVNRTITNNTINDSSINNKFELDLVNSSNNNITILQQGAIKAVTDALNAVETATENNVSEDVINEVASQVKSDTVVEGSMLGVGISTKVTNEDVKVVNEVLNEYKEVLDEQIENNFITKSEIVNEMSISLANSNDNNINIGQEGNIGSESTTTNNSSNKVDNDNTSNKENSATSEKESISVSKGTGVSTGAMIGLIVGICVIIAIIGIIAKFAANKAAEVAKDPGVQNLAQQALNKTPAGIVGQGLYGGDELKKKYIEIILSSSVLILAIILFSLCMVLLL